MNRSTVFAAAILVALAGCQGADEAETAGASAVDTTASSEAMTPSTDLALIDPEQATREELLAVRGMTAEAADALVAGRPYDDMVEVDEVLAAHMDEAEREQVYGHLWKRLDLNNATEEEILLIPGVGERMAHEFEEYRPYRAIEEFRREMAKYVDDEVIARYERYVEIR